MSVLMLKNNHTEGPGNMAAYMDVNSISYSVLEPDARVDLSVLREHDALVVLGGPMGVYERDWHPALMQAIKAAEAAIKLNIKVLGVCLGAQVVAHVLGARVYKGEAGQEKGWHEIRLTEEGITDPAFSALGESPMVLHWHGDTFDIPEGATRLAGSEMYPNQAFAYGSNVYALQFHIEATREMIGDWFADEPDIIAGNARYSEEYKAMAERFYSKFFG